MNLSALNLHPSRRAPSKWVLRRVAQALRGRVEHSFSAQMVLVDDRRIAQISEQFRGKRHATDVLAFCGDEEMPSQIVISLDTASREAKRRSIPFRHELLLLMLHGCLHVLGAEDETAHDWAQMRRDEFACLLKGLSEI